MPDPATMADPNARPPARTDDSASPGGLFRSGIQFLRQQVSGVFATGGGRTAANTADLPPATINVVGFNNKQKAFLTEHRDLFKALHHRARLLQGRPDVPKDEVRAFLVEVRKTIETAQPKYDNLITELDLAGKRDAVNFATSLWSRSLEPLAAALVQAAQARAPPAGAAPPPPADSSADDVFTSPAAVARNVLHSPTAVRRIPDPDVIELAPPPPAATARPPATVAPPPPPPLVPAITVLPPPRQSTPELGGRDSLPPAAADPNADNISSVNSPPAANNTPRHTLRALGPNLVRALVGGVHGDDGDDVLEIALGAPNLPPPPNPAQQEQIRRDHEMAVELAAAEASSSQPDDPGPTITKDDLIQRQMNMIKELEARLDRALAAQAAAPPPTAAADLQPDHPPYRGPGTQHYNQHHFHRPASDSPRSRLNRPPSPGRRQNGQSQRQQAKHPQEDKTRRPTPLFPTTAQTNPNITHQAQTARAGQQAPPQQHQQVQEVARLLQNNAPPNAKAASVPAATPAAPHSINPILDQYHAELQRFTAPPTAARPSPYCIRSGDSSDKYYFSLTYPWNTPPPSNAPLFSDYDKIKKITPHFDGRLDSYVRWRQLFIPAVHQARASVVWKVSALLYAFNTSNSALRDIADGIPGDEGGYRLAIRRLEKHYGHPLGVLGARQRALASITKVRRNDTATIHKLYLKLEDLINELHRLGRSPDAFASHLYEDTTAKLDADLTQDFHLWNSAVAKHAIPNAVTVLAWLDELLDSRRAQALPTPQPSPRPPPSAAQVLHQSTQQQAGQDSFNTHTFVCPFDGDEHRIIRCPKFTSATPNDRRIMLQKARRCFSCLEEGHDTQECTRSIKCKECDKKHHTLLHGAKFFRKRTSLRAHTAQVLTDSESEEEEEEPTTHVVCHAGHKSRVALQTVPVQCINPLNGHVTHLNCMLDSGATASFISRKAAEELGLQGRAAMATIKGFNGASFEQEIMVSHLILRTHNSEHEVSVQVVQDPAASYSPFDWTKVQHLHEHLRNIPIQPPVPNKVVDLMLGQATPHLISALEPDISPPQGNGPIARKTALGWTVGGPTGTANNKQEADSFYVLKCHSPNASLSCSAHRWDSFHFTTEKLSTPPPPPQKITGGVPALPADRQLHDLVQRMFDIDDAAGPLANSVRDEQVFAHLRRHMRLVGGRYELPVLWKKKPPPLLNNFSYACSRLRSLEASKVFACPQQRETYVNQITDWESMDFVEKVHTDTPATDKAYYLAHFAVLNPHKLSSQLRTVMDAAAKPHGRSSLNDHVHKGPKLVTELVTVLLRFRRHAVAVGADIEKMFHKLVMPQEDRDYHRFLWRKSPSDEISIYRWKSHVFGNAGSPCVAIFATKEHARKNRDAFPSAAETIIKSTLVDDSLDSRPTPEEAFSLLTQLRELLALMDMQLKKVVSNNSHVLTAVDPEAISPGLQLAEFCNKDAPLPTLKTLGVIYKTEGDYFTFSLPSPPCNTTWTKRKILQFEARLYDPHGLVLPYIIAARMILQHLWREGLGWDDPCPPDILNKWTLWLEALPALGNIQIPRCIHPTNLTPTSVELHIFCDASAEAYAAVAYAVCHYDSSPPTSRLLLARGRVAPIRQVSIPRLELMAAELALELAFCITAAYSIPMSAVNFWSDSATVLCWLHNDTKVLTTFVGTRTAKIQRATAIHHWRHVPSAENPADIPSRGLLPNQLQGSLLWLYGPPFLCTQQWPQQPDSVRATAAALDEVKKGAQFTFTVAPPSPPPTSLKDGYLYSKDDFPVPLYRMPSWTRAVRITAWCLRFKYPTARPTLAAREIQEAERRILLHIQQACFSRTLADLNTTGRASAASTINKLGPIIALDGLIRANSRLRLAMDIPFHTRFPIIIPKDHPFVQKLILRAHLATLHGAQNVVLNHLLRHYWIVNGRAMVRRVASSCTACRRRDPIPFNPPMAPLPPSRLGPTHDTSPFSNVGLDMAGPFLVKNSHLEAQRKRYFAIFTCLSTRAVHLEPLLSATASSFLFALERFITRRRSNGCIATIYSDHGTNIKAAQPELQSLLSPPLASAVEDRFLPTVWHFNPPSGSHFGGVYERLIAAVKRALYHALPTNHPTTDEEFSTTLVVVEGILNSRPLSFVPDAAGEPLPLTPADALGLPPYRMIARAPSGGWNKRKAWHLHQARLDCFWRRFREEVVPHMQTSSKWHKGGAQPAVGDIVTLLDEKARGKWPLARVTKVFPSPDGITRRVQLRLPSGALLLRPTHVLGKLLQDQ